ncbi:MAG: protein kinase [Planctomycetales bacterium]|nr:protein kinase [Planctomycetales bacterium]MBN8625370.1 protein kinase [Planctomycetota bacterium]
MSTDPRESMTPATVPPAYEATPRMEEADLRQASRLSLEQLKPPANVAGYEKQEFLGRGAFGEVWKAIDSNSGRAVAIKYYTRRGGLDWSHMAREVEKLQHLFSDRYVVQLLGVGWEADPPYYVMEYMEYGSLEDRLRTGTLTVADAVRIIRETAQGLVHAHDKGILHCDLKPSNIMLDQDGRPRLADFGQARLKHDRAPSLGTLFYMAPEQADLKATPDARWDVYALGTILYRMVTGKLPFLTDEVATSVSSQGPIDERLRIYRDTLHSSPPPTAHRHVPGVDRALAEIIDHCLAFDPKHRYRNVQSVLTALEMRQAKRSQRSLLLLGLLGPALVVAVMGGVAAFLLGQTLQTAQRQLLARTLESDQFAARTIASQFSMGVDKRWRMLEQDAGDPLLRKALALEEPAAKYADEVGRWLQTRHAERNKEFSPTTMAAYWFVLDLRGRLLAISPPNPELIGKYFGFREYFHGQGREHVADASVPPPITAPHRSNVFRSRPTNRPAVAFSVPIFRDESRREVRGILAMETELGHFSEFTGSRNQFAVLVDLRADQTGAPGLVVEHPYFDEQLSGGRPAEEFYLTADTLTSLRAMHEERLSALRDQQVVARQRGLPTWQVDSYRDPIGRQFSGEWLAAFEPVFVTRGLQDVVDTGWGILVQERRQDTLQPFEQLRTLLRRGGWVALALVVFVIGALWGVVVLVINPPAKLRRSRLFRGTGTATSGSVSLSSRSVEDQHSTVGGVR